MTTGNNMSMVSGMRSTTVLRFWNASRAWYNRDGAEEGWTIESLISELRGLTFIRGPVAQMASELLQRVIHDEVHRKAGVLKGELVDICYYFEFAQERNARLRSENNG